jgi:hypothetical protein
MSASPRLACTACFLALSGCATGIKVKHLPAETFQAKGAPWNLGMTQFKITITRHIVGCGAAMRGKVEVLPSATLVLDEQQRYVLSSSGWWSTSDITSNLASTGIGTGLNAQSTDTTATVISNVVGTIVSAAIGLAGAAKAPPPPGLQLCTTDTANAVAELYPGGGAPSLKARIDKGVADLASATAKVSLLTAQAKADASLKKDLVRALAEQAKAQAQLAAEQEKFTKLLGLTTDVQVVSWPRRADEFRKDEPYRLPRDVLDRWTTKRPTPVDTTPFDVYLALYRRTDAGWGPPTKPAAMDDCSGVPVRLPQTGRLLICTTQTCPETLKADATLQKTETASDVTVLQLGALYIVPAKGGPFRSETAAVTIDGNGQPTVIQSAEKVSGASALATSTKDVSTQLAGLPAQVRAAQLAKTQAEVAQLNANAALAAAEANAAVQGQTSSLAAQTALVNAQTALATAKMNAGLPLETAGVNAQTALLNAQAALANAQTNAQNIDQTSALAAQTTLTNAQTAQINAAAALAKAQATTP